MSDFGNIGDSDFDVVRNGGNGLPDEMERFLRDFDEAFPEPSTEACEREHLAAMMQAAQLLTEKGDPVARPASNARGSAQQISELPKSRRSRMLQKAFASIYARVAIGVLAALLAFSGVAFAGALPDGLQNAVAGLVAPVGIDLPTGHQSDIEEGTPVEASDEAIEAEDADDDATAVDEDSDEATASASEDEDQDSDERRVRQAPSTTRSEDAEDADDDSEQRSESARESDDDEERSAPRASESDDADDDSSAEEADDHESSDSGAEQSRDGGDQYSGDDHESDSSDDSGD